MAVDTNEVHFLMVTIAMQGHMNPMLRLAKRLVSKGIHITLAVNDVARHRMLKSKVSTDLTTITQNNNPKPPGINLAFFSDGLSLEFDRDKCVDLFINSLRTIGSHNLSNLITNFTTQDKKFSCIISNPFVPWMADIAAKHGIPCAMLWIQACSVYSLYYHYFNFPNSFPLIENPNESIELPGFPILLVKDLPSFLFPSSPAIFKEVLTEFLQNLDKVKWVLVNTFIEIEEEVIKSMNYLHPIYPIGPLVSPFLLGEEEKTIGNVDMWNSDENSCIEWLDKKPNSSVIYISFGTIIVLSQKQIDNLSMALKNCNKPFLWVTNGSELPNKFLEETKERGKVVRWCPQEKVLMHKAVACFITHCGWNSSVEAVAAGVPMIAYPEWTDQPTVAKFLVDVLKVGVRIKVDQEDGVASTEEIEKCIMEIIDGEKAKERRKRAVELKEAATRAMANGGSSDKNIDLFISEIIGQSLNTWEINR